MKNTGDFAKYLYKHSFMRYLLIGGSTFALDILMLFTLHAKLDVKIAAATSIAYWVSITYNFLLNRYWTFSISEKEDLQKHITSYFLLLVINYFFTVVFVSFFSHHMSYILAKALAVIIQMTWTYYLYKNYIFTSKNQIEEK